MGVCASALPSEPQPWPQPWLMILPMEIEIDKGIAKYNEIQRNEKERECVYVGIAIAI